VKILMFSLIGSALLAFAGCSTPQPVPAKGDAGPWTNIYKGNPNLAGVSVEQYPEGHGSVDAYIGQHPASIWFVFWDGDVREYLYSPDGKVINKSTLYDVFKPGSDLWQNVDFSYGSDPAFIKHPDPHQPQ
jgi:hypothetical protein